MRRKYFIIVIVGFLFIIISIAIFIAPNNKKNIIHTKFVYVIKKEIISNDYKINVIDYNSDNEESFYDIIIKDKNVWNLILTDKVYFIVYDATNKSRFILQQIEIKDNDN